MTYTEPQPGSVWYHKTTGDELVVDRLEKASSWFHQVHYTWYDGTHGEERLYYWSSQYTQTPPKGRTRTQYLVVFRTEEGANGLGPVRSSEQAAIKAYRDRYSRRKNIQMLRVISRTVTETTWKPV